MIMYLHKTDGTTATEPSVRNAAKPPPPQAAKSSAPVPPVSVHSTAVPRSASTLIAAAGLPVDKLSASIISFARFFSLPLKPELMTAMRRQAVAQPSAMQADAVKQAAANAAAENAPETGAAAKIREALSLAGAAAESKGVELHPKGLEAFAEAIDPDWQKREDSGEGNQRGRRNKNHHQQEEENAPDKTVPAKIAAITAAGLKQMALESAEKNPLLAILNRLPGKNGRRWIVLPFSFDEGGREFKVSLRILLEADQFPHHTACMAASCVALDIAESGERRWLFALESANGLPAKKLTVYLQPELPPEAQAPLARELSALMEIPLERISIRNRTESFPCESDGADDLLRSINEAV
jgi:hypothetical protein